MMSSAVRRALVLLRIALILVGWLSAPRTASAYPWMIRHEYTACAQCHTDPSGGGVLTAYGRGLGAIEMVSRFKKPSPDGEDYGKEGDFLFGATKLPDAVLAQADLRGLGLYTSNGQASDSRFVLMQADAALHINAGNFRAQGSLGAFYQGGAPAWITGGGIDDVHLGSRTHWVGYELKSDDESSSLYFRAGRMNLPFGLRSIEHTLWARSLTRTDTNSAQQHGISVAYNREGWRAEAMAVLGNFQVSPDKFRDRGATGYLEHSLSTRLAVGVSGQVMHAERDVQDLAATWRHAYGAFARYSPSAQWVISAEADFLYNTFQTKENRTGFVSYATVDYEPWKGLHLLGTGETAIANFGQGTNFGAWGGAAWFFLPHTDLRLDYVYRSFESDAGSRSSTNALLAQLHMYL